MDEENVTDANVVSEEDVPSTAVAIASPAPAPATLYGSVDPGAITAHVTGIANELSKVIEDQELSTPMGGGRKHVNVEGWQVCGTFLGVQPHVVSVERIEPIRTFPVKSQRKKWGKVDGKRVVIEETENTWEAEGWSYKAYAEAKTLDGRVVGSGFGLCSREESKWQSADEYAVIGMASTRAVSRAMRQALGFVVAMAGYSATPTDEMPNVASTDADLPAYGPELEDEELVGKTREALAYLLDSGDGPDTFRAASLWDTIVKDCGGYMPLRVARGLLHTAAVLKAKVEGADTGQPEPEPEPTEPDPGEPDGLPEVEPKPDEDQPKED